MRLDKLLSHAGYGSRKDVKALIKKGLVTIGGSCAGNPELRVDPDRDEIAVGGETVAYVKYQYILMNKPEGVISATYDPHGKDKTVSELAFETAGIGGLFPVGRLDKDATGLIILTNDGILAHRATSPKKNVRKVYEVKVSGTLTEWDISAFKNGVRIDGGYLCREAGLEVLSSRPESLSSGPESLASGPESLALVTLTEGKFHQVKRMFQAVGKQVINLKRVSFCGIPLPEDLPEGQCRPLTESELDLIAPYMAGD